MSRRQRPPYRPTLQLDADLAARSDGIRNPSPHWRLTLLSPFIRQPARWVTEMKTMTDVSEVDVLGSWAATRPQRVRLYGRVVEAGLRFAFYGRVSTGDYQDPVSSRRWQFDFASELVAGHGRIVAEYFDVGYSREIAWNGRPEAARLLAAITDADRGFDAIVVGEYARAFYGSQATYLAPLLREHGVQLWLPEADGPVDLDNPTHQALLMLLGAQAKQEVQRARFRTTAAMQAQAREQGRHLGGRPPYGYRIVDAGPHFNRAHAAWGRRLHRLEPDPETAPWVRWIFARRLEGHSTTSITRMLNEMSEQHHDALSGRTAHSFEELPCVLRQFRRCVLVLGPGHRRTLLGRRLLHISTLPHHHHIVAQQKYDMMTA